MKTKRSQNLLAAALDSLRREALRREDVEGSADDDDRTRLS